MGSRTAFSLAPDVHAPAAARAHLRQAGSEWTDELLEVALLAASELVTNAVRHGAGQVTLVLSTADELLRIEVQDRGDTSVAGLLDPGRPNLRPPSNDVRSAAGRDLEDCEDCEDCEDEGGRGLSIVKALATRWGVTSGPHRPGVTVWLELRLDP